VASLLAHNSTYLFHYACLNGNLDQLMIDLDQFANAITIRRWKHSTRFQPGVSGWAIKFRFSVFA